MKARIFVTLKPGVLDPQGQAIHGALGALGFQGIESVRQGKVIDVELADEADAEARLRAMCEKLLANTVIENYRVEPLWTDEYFLSEEKHREYFVRLQQSSFGTVHEACRQPPLAGVYAFFDDTKAIYIGRTAKRGLGPRMRNHLTLDPNQGVLAFKIARREMEIAPAYSGVNTRKNLMKNSEFLAAFRSKIEHVSRLQVKFVEIIDPDEQYIFEYYASKRLGSLHNDFNTH